MEYTAHIAEAYPCAKECVEILSKMDLLRDVLLHEIATGDTFTVDCEDIFREYRELWIKVQDLIHDIYETKNITFWNLNRFGRYTLYETDLAVDDVYFIKSVNKIGDVTVTFFDLDELKKSNERQVG